MSAFIEITVASWQAYLMDRDHMTLPTQYSDTTDLKGPSITATSDTTTWYRLDSLLRCIARPVRIQMPTVIASQQWASRLRKQYESDDSQ